MRIADFSRSDVEAELQEIFWHEAARVDFMQNAPVSSGSRAAEDFLGTAIFYGDDPSPEDVDLSRFPIAQEFLDLYDELIGAEPPSFTVYPAMATLLAFTHGLPSVDLHGDPLRFSGPEGICRRLAEAAMVRWKLQDYIDSGDGLLLTVREMAIAADMSEGAVRNALSSKGPDRLESVTARGQVGVHAAVALRWLARRRNFTPIIVSPQGSDLFWKPLEKSETETELAEVLQRFLLGRYGEPAIAARKIGLPVQPLDEVFAGRLPADETVVRRLGEALDLAPDRLWGVVRRLLA